MRIRDIDVPRELLRAQRQQKLVVFAGAGISRPQPSGLPTFEALVNDLSRGLLRREGNESFDTFLGKLEGRKVNIQAGTREIIDRSDSRPTFLHRDVVRLFTTPESVRIVTTNFDRHFTSVLEETFPGAVERFYGPALPLGRDMDGLVYLHGAVERARSRLVLTDRDFGQAYLRDGWATRFLVELFDTYTVLFIGYSHSDPPMNYLTRSLLKPTLRFAFVEAGQEERWKQLDIVALPYPVRDEGRDHSALAKGLAGWADLVQMGILDHDHRIREIVRSSFAGQEDGSQKGAPPLLSPEDLSYLEEAVQEVDTLRLFTRVADAPEWLRWMEGLGELAQLFDGDVEPDDRAPVLAAWASSFMLTTPGALVTVARRSEGRFRWPLWNEMVMVLMRGNELPPPEMLRMWVTFLLSSAPPTPGVLAHLCMILDKLRMPDDRTAALLLFDFLTAPWLQPQKLSPFFAEGSRTHFQLDADLRLSLETYLAQEAWSKVFQPNLEHLAPDLLVHCTHHLGRGHRLMQGANLAHEHWDPVSFRRSAIESHEQDYIREDDTDLLIDFTRDTIEWLVRTDPMQARKWIGDWIRSDAPLLRRLAVHALSGDATADPDETLAWIRAHSLVHVLGMKHEVFALLRTAYARASDEARRSFVDWALQPSGVDGSADAEAQAYERYNLLIWLQEAAPACDIVRTHLENLQRLHPQFERRKYPDLDRWTVIGRGEEEGVTAEELLARPAAEWVDELVGDRFRSGRLDIEGAVTQSFQWGWELASALLAKGGSADEPWDGILSGWGRGSWSEAEWERIVHLFETHDELHRQDRALAGLFLAGISREESAIPLGLLDRVDALTERLVFDRTPNPPGILESDEWLTVAINHVTGTVVQAWLQSLSRRIRNAADEITTLPAEHRRFFERVINDGSERGRLGRVVLASQLHFLLSVDRTWGSEWLVPLFDWVRNPKQARQAWDGFLVWGRPSETVLAELFPMYVAMFSHLEALGEQRKQFAHHLAVIATYSSYDPGEGWLETYILQAGDEARIEFAWAVKRVLGQERQDEALLEKTWTRWLREYWTRRVRGVPARITPDEGAVMVQWTLHLVPVFSEAVELACQTEAEFPHNLTLVYQLDKNTLPDLFPTESLRLLAHVLNSNKGQFYLCPQAARVIERAAAAKGDLAACRQACEAFSRVGCSGGADLLKRCAGAD